MGSRQWAERHQLWQVNPLFHYRGDLRVRGPTGTLRWHCWRERRRGTKHPRGTQAGDKGPMKGQRGSARKRTDRNPQIIKWAAHQTRPRPRAKASPVKPEATEPVEKDRELDAPHPEHVTHTPGPKREGTDPSVHTRTSEGGEDSPPEADRSRAAPPPAQSGMKGETVKWAVVHGGKGGHTTRAPRRDGSGHVAEEQNDPQEGSLLSR